MSDIELLALGMRTAEIYLEREEGRVAERELQIGHLAMSAFDDVERRYFAGGSETEVAGFTIEVVGQALVFQNSRGLRPRGVVDAVLAEIYPEDHHLFCHEFVDDAGYATRLGIDANDIFDHPYTLACFGLAEDSALTGIDVRLCALDRLGVPRPHQDTLDLMKATLRHNRPTFSREVERQAEIDKTRGQPSEAIAARDLTIVARAKMTNRNEVFEGDDLRRMSGRRMRFMSHYPGSELIFGPYPPEDKTLATIRSVVQTTMKLTETDDAIATAIGHRTWLDFARDPGGFCLMRLPHMGPGEDDIAHTME